VSSQEGSPTWKPKRLKARQESKEERGLLSGLETAASGQKKEEGGFVRWPKPFSVSGEFLDLKRGCDKLEGFGSSGIGGASKRGV